MRKFRYIIVLLIIAAITYLFLQLISEVRTMSVQINAMQSEITAIRKHDVSQDKWIGDVAAMRQKPIEPAQTIEEAPISIPAIVPLPLYIGAMETLKQFIFGR